VSRKNKYWTAPDGLPARDVGPWVARKDHYVDQQAVMFTTAMKNKWPRRAYVELFSGPGMSYDRSRRLFVPGSALRALERNFTHYAFVDRDSIATTALAERIRRLGKDAPVIARDCNAAVADIRSVIPHNALTLAFIDPTNFQARFSTVAALVDGRPVDLLLTFHAGILPRLDHLDPKVVNLFFDTDRWHAALRVPRWERVDAMLGLYNAQLQQLGYLPSWSLRVPVKNTKNVSMYDLVVFSKHPRGVDLWGKVASGADPSGQRGFWDAA
jgi:three-Cys-motif partner protein